MQFAPSGGFFICGLPGLTVGESHVVEYIHLNVGSLPPPRWPLEPLPGGPYNLICP